MLASVKERAARFSVHSLSLGEVKLPAGCSTFSVKITNRLPGFIGTSPPAFPPEAALDKAFCREHYLLLYKV